MSSEIAIKVENLSKCYEIYAQPHDRLKHSIYPRLQRLVGKQPKQYFREFWALKDVSFEVKKGETVGIIGRNGSGKSTLLQMICGTLNSTSGSIRTNGRIAALLELGSGFNPEFTGRENVYMNAAVLGLMNEETVARFDDIAAFADIGDFIEQPVKTYSSGMMVRLAFAVAINVNPQILIIDEALSVGDELFQRKCFARIEAIKNNGATILFVSHSGGAIVELCDNAVLLDAGEKLAMGAPKTIVGKYQKLIYAPQDKRLAIREEIRASGTGGWQSSATSHSPQAITRPLEIKQSAENDLEELFDPNLKPQSTLEYESHGVYIDSPEILTLSGKKVNCLKRGESYRYSYKVKFDKGETNVRFGMMIKTISGLELGGAVSVPSVGQSIAYLAPGTVVGVEFRFTCNLNPGSYYLNAGVTGTHQEEETYLHRVLDFYMFKVMPVSGNTATALIDFNCVAELEFINNDVKKVAEE
jgi:lipopolysaccharide transport system ATP-binding protein